MTSDYVIELSSEKSTVMWPPPCNTVEFIQNVTQIVRAREKKKLWTMFIVILLLISLSSIGFVLHTKHDTVFLVLAIFMIVFAFILTIVVLVGCCQYSFVGENHLKLIGLVRHVWQFTGENWNKQVAALRVVPFRVIGCYSNSRHQRLKNRLYGNIILTEKGILIDELFLIDFGEVVISNIAQIIDGTGTVIFRMHLLTRINYKSTFSSGNPKEFDFDLIIPENFRGEALLDLQQQMLLHSRICPVNFFYY